MDDALRLGAEHWDACGGDLLPSGRMKPNGGVEIISFGVGCGRRDYLGIYLNVAFHLKCIRESSRSNFEMLILECWTEYPKVNGKLVY